MPLIRFNPLWEFENISHEFDKIRKQVTMSENWPRVEFGGFKPRVDIIEDDENIYFEVEIPGVNKEDVKVSVNDENILTIKGEKKFERKEEANACCRNERTYGIFTRSFQLPDESDYDKIEAKFENGILYLTVPKIEPVKPKEVNIEIK